jgi:hypothetical protein
VHLCILKQWAVTLSWRMLAANSRLELVMLPVGFEYETNRCSTWSGNLVCQTMYTNAVGMTKGVISALPKLEGTSIVRVAVQGVVAGSQMPPAPGPNAS